jgi:hypothetical protein
VFVAVTKNCMLFRALAVPHIMETYARSSKHDSPLTFTDNVLQHIDGAKSCPPPLLADGVIFAWHPQEHDALEQPEKKWRKG